MQSVGGGGNTWSGVLALGQFDGVHLGHRTVVRAAAALAGEVGGEPGALSFWPPAERVLRPESAPPLLATREQDERWLKEAGAKVVRWWGFDAATGGLSGEEFLERLAEAYPGLRGVACGEDFSFGKGGAWGAEELQVLGARLGWRVAVAEGVEHGGERISSTRIRAAVARGKLEEARAMLGRSFAVSGRVVHGRAVGRTRGLPTANVEPLLGAEGVWPLPGVYAGRLRLEDGRVPWGGVFVPDRADGRQSVFGGVMEIHLPGFSGDLYGAAVELRLGRRLRGFTAFGSEAEAAERIRRDLQEMEDEAGRIESV